MSAFGRRVRSNRPADDLANPDELKAVYVRMPASVRAKAERLAQARNVSLAGLLTDLVLAAEEPPALLDVEEVTTSAA